MFHRLLAILLIGGLLLQSSREALIGLWFKSNQERIAEQHCINKDEPLLMCQGKCYLQKVIETEAREDAPGPAKRPAPEERMPFHALLTPRLYQARLNQVSLWKKPGFSYLPLFSVELITSLFRPPWD